MYKFDVINMGPKFRSDLFTPFETHIKIFYNLIVSYTILLML